MQPNTSVNNVRLDIILGVKAKFVFSHSAIGIILSSVCPTVMCVVTLTVGVWG